MLGVGSNLLVRDGGVKGVVVRLMRGFTGIAVDGHELVAGAGAPDLNVALTAREHALAGLEFLSGIPGTIGGAVRDERRRLWRRDRRGAGLGRSRRPRRAGATRDAGRTRLQLPPQRAPADWIFTSARLRAAPGDQVAIARRIAEIDAARIDSQPRSRTGGSTFVNPPGHKAWELIDRPAAVASASARPRSPRSTAIS